MAEGRDFASEDDRLNYNLDYNDDDDEKQVNTTRPFQLGAASAPYHGGEQHPMQTMMHEQSDLSDTSYGQTILFKILVWSHSNKSRQLRCSNDRFS